MLLKEKTAIIYGASGAVGGAVAKAFAREGARLFLAARKRDGLETIAETIRQTGGSAEIATVDATDARDVEQHLQDVAAKAGPVGIMFNAISWDDLQGTELTKMRLEDMLLPVRLALTTLFVTGTALARHMAENGGVIIGITANAGREAYPGVGGFGIACAAAEHYLRQIAVENGPMGVRACWVRSPGSPDAPGVREVWQAAAEERGLTFDEYHRQIAADTPLRRITALAQVADAAVLLASDLAAGMTATAANATGGAQVD